MNTKEYIASGIIESYVLGLISDAEAKEFETNCNLYPEIAQARNSFELSLEQTLVADAQPVPQFIKLQVQEKLTSAQSEPDENEFEESRTPVRYLGAWKWMAAASIILLLGTAYWAFTTQNKLTEEQRANAQLKEQLDQNTIELAARQRDAQIIGNPGMKMASMSGTQLSPQSSATVFWDTAGASKDVYLMVSNLPQPASNEQYQLWALFNGSPVTLGVFDFDIKQQKLLVKMQNAQNAQAFAITLERKGGSATPTMNKMYVQGTL